MILEILCPMIAITTQFIMIVDKVKEEVFEFSISPGQSVVQSPLAVGALWNIHGKRLSTS